MSALQTPYFIWDYDLTEADVQAMLRGDDEQQKAWLVARLLESARYEDIWQYISLAEVRAAREFALAVWTSEPPDER